MNKLDVSSIEIRDYAQSMGWKLVKEALRDGLFVLNSPNDDNTQLIFPKDSSIPEYLQLATVSLNRLVDFYKCTYQQIIEQVREVNDDVISLRYFSDSKNINSMSFEEALEAMKATRQMILSAASTVVNPILYHPKLNRTDPQELIKKTKFRHTQEGSFIIKISIPFEAPKLTNTLFDSFDENVGIKSIGRQTVELISNASKEIIESIDSNSIVEFYETEVNAERPVISYNFCDSLTKLFDDERELPFELIFNWSKASLLNSPPPSVLSRVSFPYNYKIKIEELKSYLAPKTKETTDIFYATVESLNGDIVTDGKRAGEVTFAVLIENDLVRARANLDVEQYQNAIRAHENGGAYVMIKGILNRQGRIATISNIIDLKLADK